MLICLSLPLALTTQLTTQLYGQGLISKLPSDPKTVVYDIDFEFLPRGGDVTKRDMVLYVRSVGRESIGKRKHRWLELQMDTLHNREPVFVAVNKFLIPEDKVDDAQGLFKNSVKYWSTELRGTKFKTPSDSKHPWLLTLVQPSVSEIKTIDSKTIKTPHGKFDCKGYQFSVDYVQPDDKVGGQDRPSQRRIYKVYSSNQSPLGCVEMHLEAKFPEGDVARYVFKLRSIAMNAQPKIKNKR